MSKRSRLFLRILTADQQVFAAEVDSIVLPAYNGRMGILKHHAPLVCRVVSGVVVIRAGDKTHSFSVDEGFLKVESNEVDMIVGSAELS